MLWSFPALADGGRFAVRANVEVLLFPQPLLAVTVMLPETSPAVTVKLVVFWPEVIDHPVGTTQAYPVALATAVIEYTNPDAFWQTAEGPVMEPVVPGKGFTVTAKEEVLLLPQELFAVTVMLPPIVPAETVTLRVFCPAVINQPEGTTQRYPVAFGTVVVEYTSPVDP